MWWKTIVTALAYAAIALGLLFGVLWGSRAFGATEPTTTLIAALGGALMASFGPVITAMLSNLGQEHDRGERIRDEVSRVALELTKMDYDLLQRALADGQAQQVLRPAKGVPRILQRHRRAAHCGDVAQGPRGPGVTPGDHVAGSTDATQLSLAQQEGTRGRT